MVGFTFFSYEPRAELAPFVECVWGVRGSAHYHVEAILPDGCVELMVNFGPAQRVVAYGDGAADDVFRRAWVSGPQAQRLVHASPDGCDHLSVRFRPGGAHAFLGLPLDAVANQVVELDGVLGDEAATLRDRLGVLTDDAARVAEVQRWLLERRPDVHRSWRVVSRGAALLDGGAGALGVAEACRRLGLSSGHFSREFRSLVGVAPKVFGRIRRFQKVVEECRGRGEDDVSWSRLAARSGYADQPLSLIHI